MATQQDEEEMKKDEILAILQNKLPKEEWRNGHRVAILLDLGIDYSRKIYSATGGYV
jgi:hypothetical protein